MMKIRTGVFGGTFNPLHLGHLVAAQDAAEQFDLARVLFVPCDRPPHKPARNLASAAHRVAMLEAGLKDGASFEVCDIEVRRGGTSYTVHTMRELRRMYPDQELVFIIGADTLLELHAWHAVEELLGLCEFVVLGRPGFTVAPDAPDLLKLPPPWPARLLARLAGGHQVDVSSSEIRYRVAEGMSIQYLVPRAVEAYISEHRLYSGPA